MWEWHAWGSDRGKDSPGGYIGTQGYDRMAGHLEAAYNRGHHVIIGEYGVATPVEDGNAGKPERNLGAFQILATSAHGPALAGTYPLNPVAWHATGDNTYDKLFKLTHGPKPGDHYDTSRRGIPFWDYDGTKPDMLTSFGRGHWLISHFLAATHTAARTVTA